MQAKNINGTNLEMVKNQFAQATADGYKPTLAIVFCSIVQDRAEIRQFLSSHHIQVFGATTAGEIQDNDVTEQTTVIMLLDAKPDTFHLYLQEATEDNTYQKCQNLAKKALELYKNPSIVLVSSGLRIDAEMIIKGVKDTSDRIDLFGGLAGDDLTMNASYVFDQNNEYPIGILGLIIDGDKIQVSGQATCGWDNIGIEKTITKSEGNVVYTIDDEPAVDVFVKFFQYKGNVITIHGDENIDTSEKGRMTAVKLPEKLAAAAPGTETTVLEPSAEAWRNPIGATSSSPVVVGDTIYQMTDGGELYATEAEGERRDEGVQHPLRRPSGYRSLLARHYGWRDRLHRRTVRLWQDDVALVDVRSA